MNPRLFLAFLLTFPVLAEPSAFEEAYQILAPVKGVAGPETSQISELEGRVMTGYQGWFRAPGDGSGMGFYHYQKKGKFLPGSCTIDLWPDLSEFTPGEKFPTEFRYADGSVAHVFSSHHPKTVDRHFKWMKDYEIDGAFVQRFAVHLKNRGNKFQNLRAENQRLLYCRDAAIAHNRAWVVMYDLSGTEAGDFHLIIKDWKLLCDRMKIGRDSGDCSYLHLNGQPLIAIWGLGFNDGRKYTSGDVEKLVSFFKSDPEYGGLSVMLGVPYGWRTRTRDAVDEPALHSTIKKADVVSPWSVGRYRRVDEGMVDHLRKDLAWCREQGLTYLPVIFPGFSWHNLTGQKPASIPRRKGEFYREQFAAFQKAGITAAYAAMFDEIDEGTAIFKCRNDPPVGTSSFLGYEGLPSDHYLRLTKKGRSLLRNGQKRD